VRGSRGGTTAGFFGVGFLIAFERRDFAGSFDFEVEVEGFF
jgi:hypothetical protein